MNVLIVALVALTQMSGKVVSIADGDTLTVRTADKTVKVRLVHIDAPESGQPFGSRSKQNLSDLTFGKTVELIGTETDRYGRLLAVVKVDGLEVNLEQISLHQQGLTKIKMSSPLMMAVILQLTALPS